PLVSFCSRYPPTSLTLVLLYTLLPHRALHSFPTRRSSDLSLGSTFQPVLLKKPLWDIARTYLGEGDLRAGEEGLVDPLPPGKSEDRKSTRLNSSHGSISYAVFCLKKKKKNIKK